MYSKRLLKDLEAKGTIRTAVEGWNLSLHAAAQDYLRAECLRTFPTVTLPASQLLRREEVETGRTSGRMATAMFHGKGDGRRTWTEAPVDLLYGFRGNSYNVDLLSAYEMMMHWSLERVLPPKPDEKDPTAQWTIEGITARKAAKAAKETFMPIAGVHYKVLPAEDRILLPDLPALCSLPDRWFWKRRTHPHVPVWSYAKIPRSRFSPEENARLLSVYMRPWTLL